MSFANKDFAAGTMYLAIGLAFAVASLNMPIGTVNQMGPGFFPLMLGSLLALTGLVIVIQSVRSPSAEGRLTRWDIKTVVIILGSVVLFGVLLLPLGFVISLLLLVVISSFASHEFGIKATAINAVALLAISIAIFFFGLRIQMPLWPSFIGI